MPAPTLRKRRTQRRPEAETAPAPPPPTTGTPEAEAEAALHVHTPLDPLPETGEAPETVPDAHAQHTGPAAALVSTALATHIAIADGDWFDPATWAQGEVPGDGARVIVSDGVTLIYEGVSDARIATIRVDGALHFPGRDEAALTVDTIVVSDGGSFSMGYEDEPVDASTVITFANIDQNADPGQIGLGLIGQPGAEVAIHGLEKTGRAVVDGNQLAGDDHLEIAGGVPLDWQVGDTIVLAGTAFNTNAPLRSENRFQDEVLTITEITDEGLRFARDKDGATALKFDHQVPEGFDFDIHAVNLSRAITFQSEGGPKTPTAERGHIMVHDHDSVVTNAALIGLGRTDKAIPLDPLPTTFDINGVETSIDGTGTNIPGRYPLHVHRAFDHGDDGGAVNFSGNAIWDSPGWGLVLHGSRGQIHDNVVFDTVGAGIVTEDGDEEGYFTGNTVIKVGGRPGVDNSPKNIVTLDTAEGLPIDYGLHGDGFWFDTSYSVRQATDNVVSSVQHSGMFIYGHNDNEINRYVDPANAPDELSAYIQGGVIDPFRVPVGVVEGNQIYNAQYGMFLAGLLRDDLYNGGNASRHGGKTLEHLERNVFEDFDLWGIRKSGVQTAYAQGFEFRDFTIVGDPVDPNDHSNAQGNASGIHIHKNAHNVVIEDVHVEGFYGGLNIGQGGSQGYNDVDPFDLFQISDVTLANNVHNFLPSQGRTGPVPQFNNPLLDDKPFNPYAVLTGTLVADLSANDFDPVASAVAQRIDTLGWRLDARASYDLDHIQDAQRANREVIENSIAFYQWDTDGDGEADQFGRDVIIYYDEESDDERTVTLTVTDGQGAQASTEITLANDAAVSRNAFADGGFDIPENVEKGGSDIHDAREVTGFLHKDWGAGPDFNDPRWMWEDGYARVTGGERYAQILNQLEINRAEHRGEGIFTFDIIYHEGNGRTANTLNVKVWGINGAPEITSSSSQKPKPIYRKEPFEADLLLNTGNLLGDGPFEWKTVTSSVDFGDGYEYLYVEFNGSRIGAKGGDFVAVDNVSLNAVVEEETESIDLL